MSNPVDIVNEVYNEIFEEKEKIRREVVLRDYCKLYLSDCIDLMEKMREDDVKVDLTVTSPPYDCLRKYKGDSVWNFEVFKKIAQKLYDITSDGGIVVWVVGDATVKGSETGTSFRQALYFMELGFKLHDTMIYEKNSAAYPARHDGNRYTQIFEYMFVFFKGKKIRHAELTKLRKTKWEGFTNWGEKTHYTVDGELVKTGNNKPIPKYCPENNIWKYSTGFNKCKGKHPAVFPYKLAEDHILSWSGEGDTVFDPFLGSGTTAMAAIRNGRKFIGCEIAEEYFDDAVSCIEGEIQAQNR